MNIPDFRVAGWLWPVGPPSKLGMGHFWADFSVKVGPAGGLAGPISKHGFLGMGPCSWFGCPLFGVKKCDMEKHPGG